MKNLPTTDQWPSSGPQPRRTGPNLSQPRDVEGKSMSNPYVKTETKYGREERSLDIHRFARDLAKAIGGKVIPQTPGEIINERYASIEIDGAAIGLTAGWRRNDLEKVTVRISPLGLKLSYNDTPRGDGIRSPGGQSQHRAPARRYRRRYQAARDRSRRGADRKASRACRRLRPASRRLAIDRRSAPQALPAFVSHGEGWRPPFRVALSQCEQ